MRTLSPVRFASAPIRNTGVSSVVIAFDGRPSRSVRFKAPWPVGARPAINRAVPEFADYDYATSAFRIAVLASGSGTNLQAILDRLHGRDGIEVVGVGSDRPGATALERARAAGVEAAAFAIDRYPDRAARDLAIADWLDSRAIDLLVLAGYMQLLSGAFVRRFEGRIVNLHPALLPAFPGLDAIGQALAHGVRVTGVTVHFVERASTRGRSSSSARCGAGGP
ncbi:MAG: phosphoribosylglycinamide formyltransferase [Solirubrobacterales bacterium]|nr:phosphoribosylglycinamide formyltransferase [Solirubrobacterales bacterium]